MNDFGLSTTSRVHGKFIFFFFTKPFLYKLVPNISKPKKIHSSANKTPVNSSLMSFSQTNTNKSRCWVYFHLSNKYIYRKKSTLLLMQVNGTRLFSMPFWAVSFGPFIMKFTHNVKSNSHFQIMSKTEKYVSNKVDNEWTR